MKQKTLVTGLIVSAAFACIAIIAYLGQYSGHKKLLAEKAKVESELRGVKEALTKTQDALNKAESAIAELKVQAEQILKAKAEEEAMAKALQEQIALTTLRRAEGFEHTAIRFFLSKNKKLPQAQKEAHRTGKFGGYVDVKTGREVRFKGRGGNIAFPLTTDDKGNVILITEYKKDKDGKFKPVIERKLAPKSSKFLGDTKGAVQPYGYIHSPK